MVKNERIARLVLAQGVDFIKSATTEQPYEQVNHHTFTQKLRGFLLAESFRHVWEKSSEYLALIAKAPGYQRQNALEVAKEDIKFGIDLLAAPKQSLTQRLKSKMGFKR